MMSKRQALLLGAAATVLAGAGWLVWSQRVAGAGLFEEGRAALQAGRAEEAQKAAVELEQQGYFAESRILRAAFWLHEGRSLVDRLQASEHSPQEAIEVQTRARQAFQLALSELTQTQCEDPLAGEATLIAAECLIRTGEHRLPAEGLKALVRRAPDNVQAHRLLTAIYVEIGARDDAVRHYREWARLEPADGRPHLWIGFFYQGQNKFGEAAEAYEQACRRELSADFKAKAVREWAETLLEGQAAFPLALEVLGRCPADYALTPEIRVLKAECLWGLNRTGEATQLIEAVLNDRPHLSRALMLRARMLFAQDRAGEATPPLEQVLKQDAHDVAARHLLLEAYLRLGDQAKADEQRRLKEATQEIKTQLTRLHGLATARPWDDDVRFEIAQLCLKIDRPKEAAMWLKACLAVNRNHAEARARLQHLALPELALPQSKP